MRGFTRMVPLAPVAVKLLHGTDVINDEFRKEANTLKYVFYMFLYTHTTKRDTTRVVLLSETRAMQLATYYLKGPARPP